MTYHEACDLGYDGPPPRRRRYSCGGYASATGHCGATDCETCYPHGEDEEEEEESDERAELQRLQAKFGAS